MVALEKIAGYVVTAFFFSIVHTFVFIVVLSLMGLPIWWLYITLPEFLARGVSVLGLAIALSYSFTWSCRTHVVFERMFLAVLLSWVLTFMLWIGVPLLVGAVSTQVAIVLFFAMPLILAALIFDDMRYSKLTVQCSSD